MAGGDVVRAIPAPNTADKSRKFFDDMNDWAQREGFAGLGYVTRKDGEFGGPIAKNHGEEGMKRIAEDGPRPERRHLLRRRQGSCRPPSSPALARTRIGEQLELIDESRFEFCWIVDFPMFEYDEDAKKIDFSHNPFSMPQGEMEALETKDPLDILAYQYDIVCNGVELSSGAIRNHRPEIMYKAFEIAGYTQDDVDTNFAGMINAFKFGAPPHGGSAPGIDRIVMLLADEPNIREVIAVPDEPEGRRPDDGGAELRDAEAAARTQYPYDRAIYREADGRGGAAGVPIFPSPAAEGNWMRTSNDHQPLRLRGRQEI